jgi:hypothetical protein
LGQRAQLVRQLWVPLCIAHWNLVHTLDELVHAHKQSSMQVSPMSLQELPTPMVAWLELDLLRYELQELMSLKESVPKRLVHNLGHIFITGAPVDLSLS